MSLVIVWVIQLFSPSSQLFACKDVDAVKKLNAIMPQNISFSVLC